MPLLLVLLFPLAEIATFIIVGGAIGLLRTLILVILSSAIGAIMLRDAGAVTVMKLQRQRENPATILAEGGTRMLAGLLLLIPGFLTDLAAALLLVPGIRHSIFKRLSAQVPTAHSEKPTRGSDVIDGDFRRLDR
jgi:UPF0716 protein FxsA